MTGDVPVVLSRVKDHPGTYTWTPKPGVVYTVRRDRWASANLWDITFPDGTTDHRTTLGDTRKAIGQHWIKAQPTDTPGVRSEP